MQLLLHDPRHELKRYFGFFDFRHDPDDAGQVIGCTSDKFKPKVPPQACTCEATAVITRYREDNNDDDHQARIQLKQWEIVVPRLRRF
jgi:hypothetical protein